jgi:hypothetical protein
VRAPPSAVLDSDMRTTLATVPWNGTRFSEDRR